MKIITDDPVLISGIGDKKSNNNTQWYLQDRVYDGSNISVSLCTCFNPYYQVGGERPMRIRKLTPNECGKLMAVAKNERIAIAKQSDASQYHLYGDSIVTTCLMAIFGELLDIDYKTKIKELVKDLENDK